MRKDVSKSRELLFQNKRKSLSAVFPTPNSLVNTIINFFLKWKQGFSLIEMKRDLYPKYKQLSYLEKGK